MTGEHNTNYGYPLTSNQSSAGGNTRGIRILVERLRIGWGNGQRLIRQYLHKHYKPKCNIL
jgi:hypothetical protein